MRSAALNNLKDCDFLLNALKFITANQNNSNISILTKILILYPNGTVLELANKFKNLDKSIIEIIIHLLETKPTNHNTIEFLETIIASPSIKKAKAIALIYKSHTPQDNTIYNYFLTKIKISKEEDIDNILIEFNTFCNDIVKRNADIYSLTTEEFLKSLEQCPDLLLKDTTIDTLELATSRHLKRQTKEIIK